MSNGVPKQVYAKWKRIAEGLISATRRGSINWRSSVDADSFVTTLAYVTVKFSKGIDHEGNDEYLFEISSPEGNLVDAFNDNDLNLACHYSDAYEENEGKWLEILEDFMMELTRAENGADEYLDKLIRKLDDLELPF